MNNLSANYKLAEAHLTTDLCSTPDHETGQAAPTELETRRGRSCCQALFMHYIGLCYQWSVVVWRGSDQALYLEAKRKKNRTEIKMWCLYFVVRLRENEREPAEVVVVVVATVRSLTCHGIINVIPGRPVCLPLVLPCNATTTLCAHHASSALFSGHYFQFNGLTVPSLWLYLEPTLSARTSSTILSDHIYILYLLHYSTSGYVQHVQRPLSTTFCPSPSTIMSLRSNKTYHH